MDIERVAAIPVGQSARYARVHGTNENQTQAPRVCLSAECRSGICDADKPDTGDFEGLSSSAGQGQEPRGEGRKDDRGILHFLPPSSMLANYARLRWSASMPDSRSTRQGACFGPDQHGLKENAIQPLDAVKSYTPHQDQQAARANGVVPVHLAVTNTLVTAIAQIGKDTEDDRVAGQP